MPDLKPEGEQRQDEHNATDIQAAIACKGESDSCDGTGNTIVVQPTTLTEQKSLWEKAKEALAEASTQASSAGGALASKAAKFSGVTTTKTAEIAKQSYSASSSATRAAVDASKQAYQGSKLESAFNYIDTELDHRGAKQAIKGSTEAVIGKLDQVTGKRLLELLEGKLKSQDAYNDILATRLAEALERIAMLEAEVSKWTNCKSLSEPDALADTKTI